ncbi:MAG: NUDIX hydrolase [Anaerolineaceae bacterium]|nr:NUDIX hydrolase [Anaerolineaceae bacterium]
MTAHSHHNTGQPIRFCPLCATPVEYKQLFGEERPVCPSCGWTYFEDPKVAVAVLAEKDGQILLTQRSNPPYQGLWTLPAGFVNAHEAPERAAERECLEETGLIVRVTNILDILSGREHSRGADIFIAYQAQILGGELQAGDDASRAAFFPRNALPPLAFETTRKILFPERKSNPGK